MENYFYYLILTAGIIIGLSLFLIKQYLRKRQLEKLLDNTNSKLERLQTHFGRFAPQEVIEHLLNPREAIQPERN